MSARTRKKLRASEDEAPDEEETWSASAWAGDDGDDAFSISTSAGTRRSGGVAAGKSGKPGQGGFDGSEMSRGLAPKGKGHGKGDTKLPKGVHLRWAEQEYTVVCRILLGTQHEHSSKMQDDCFPGLLVWGKSVEVKSGCC